MQSKLSTAHFKIYQRLMEQPMPHNLQWREVWSMLGAIDGASAVEDDKGNLKVARNGQTLHLHKPRDKDLSDKNELTQIRHFLERSGTAAASPAAAGTHLLVVIDHRQARIFDTLMQGSVAQQIAPYDPYGYGRDLHYNQDESSGQRKPEQKSFYEAVVKTLRGAEQIVMFGNGTGASSAMEQLLLNLKEHHHEIAARVIGSLAVDEHHLTEAELLAKARELFAAA